MMQRTPHFRVCVTAPAQQSNRSDRLPMYLPYTVRARRALHRFSADGAGGIKVPNWGIEAKGSCRGSRRGDVAERVPEDVIVCGAEVKLDALAYVCR